MMGTWPYYLVDVFTQEKFGGNPLAVFTDARTIPEAMMQRIAKELNLSETTFVLPPRHVENDFHVRIFTPAAEMPMAGHPTIGTAFVLAQVGQILITQPEQQIIFEEGVGPIPVTLSLRPNQSLMITMQQPLPEFGPILENRAALAEMLSLHPDDLDSRYPVQVVSCGVPFTYIPLKNLAAVAAAKLRLDLWEGLLATTPAPKVFVFTSETVHPSSQVHSRMFAPSLGITEDPATGAAGGPLGAYLVKYGWVAAEPTAQIIGEQGFEMGRPSFIHISITQRGGEISRVLVGGESVAVGEGVFYSEMLS